MSVCVASWGLSLPWRQVRSRQGFHSFVGISISFGRKSQDVPFFFIEEWSGVDPP